MNQSKGIKITQLFHKGRKNTKKRTGSKKNRLKQNPSNNHIKCN